MSMKILDGEDVTKRLPASIEKGSQPQVCRFFIPGKPVPKGRHRHATVKGRTRMYTPADTVVYEKIVSLCASQCMSRNNLSKFTGPVHLDVSIQIKMPDAWSIKKKFEMFGSSAVTRGDISNIIKSIEDGMNNIVYRDDVQISHLTAKKLYDNDYGANVIVTPI